MSNYQPLVRLEISHAYFGGGWPEGMLVDPGGLTAQLLTRQVLAIRKDDKGLTVFANGKPSDVLAYFRKVYFMEGFDFTFHTPQWAFAFYTEQPLDWVGTRMYDSTQADESGLLAETLGALSNPPMGGQIKIRLADLGPDLKTYSIHFAARSTQWQYYIINRTSIALEAPVIEGGNFTGPEKVVTENGEAALLFSSGSALISLCRRPQVRFDLVDGNHTGSRVIRKGLPVPDPGWTRKVTIEGQTAACSPMYVYV
jgi:hypothetical protein